MKTTTLPTTIPQSAIRNPQSTYKWAVVALFWFAYFLNQADRQVIFSVFPLLQREMGLSETQLGFAGSLFFWIYGLLVPIAGSLGDTFSRKKIVVSALLLWSLATFGSGWVAGFGMLLVMRGFTGAGEACYYPAATSIITDYHGNRTRAFAMSLHQTSVYFGIILSGALAGYIGETYGWRMSFLSFGGVGILFALLLAVALREPVRGASDFGSRNAECGLENETIGPASSANPQSAIPNPKSLSWRVAEFFRSPTAVLLMLAFVGMNFVNAAFLPWMTKLLYERFGFSLAAAGFHATFWHHVAAFAGVLVGGRISDAWAARDRVHRLHIQIAGLLCGVPFIFLMGWSGSILVVFIALALFGLFRGLYDSNLFASLYEVVRPEARATATGIMIAAAFLIGGWGSVIVGWLAGRIGLGNAIAASSLGYVFGGLMIFLASKRFFASDAKRMQHSIADFGSRNAD